MHLGVVPDVSRGGKKPRNSERAAVQRARVVAGALEVLDGNVGSEGEAVSPATQLACAEVDLLVAAATVAGKVQAHVRRASVPEVEAVTPTDGPRSVSHSRNVV